MSYKDSIGEQIACNGGNGHMRSMYMRPGTKKWLKRHANKKIRRQGKLDPEGAPQRRSFFYWLD